MLLTEPEGLVDKLNISRIPVFILILCERVINFLVIQLTCIMGGTFECAKQGGYLGNRVHC